MRVKGLIGFVGALVAAVALISSAGAGTAASPITRQIDLSTGGAVANYLRSIHIDPSAVVTQRGLRNYAGSSCPGAGWTCTSTSRPVVQIASAAGRNVFQCSSARCAVVQVATAAAATNAASCIRNTGITQACSITQSGAAANQAVVVETAVKTTGLTQSASQTAQIVQQATGGNNGNTACVLQTLTLAASSSAKNGAVTESLDGHQSISVKQDSASGANVVKNALSDGTCASDGSLMTQSQTISQTATSSAGITQNENAAASGPNSLIDIEQNQSTPTATGTNLSRFDQSISLTAQAYTPTGPVSQTQSSAGGGLKATVNQFSGGVSTSDAKQTETEMADADKSGTDPSLPSGTLTQTQFGPVRCCSNQASNTGDSFTVTQKSTQDNDTHQNQTNTLAADCSSSGNCTATQATTVDGTTSSNTQTGPTVSAQTTCSGTSCTTTNGQANGQVTVSNTDVAEFGFGGMRGNGVGSIAVSGVSGPVTKALLYWNGPTNSTDPAANAAVNFAGTSITGTNIGFASSNCWSFLNSQSYRADVTSLVTGNGPYSLSNFVKLPDVEVNGAALIVFYNDGSTANDRNVVMFNGNDSNVTPSSAPDGWDETITGVPYPGSGSASLDLVVSDGQTFGDDALVLNGGPFVPAGGIFQGNSTPTGPGPPPPDDVNGDLWDVKSFPIPAGVLLAGSNNLRLTTGLVSDCLSLVVALASVPAAAAPIG